MTTAIPELTISRWRWFRLISDLRRRGAGTSESGAFLLAAPNSRRITRYALFDDLEPGCLRGTHIRFTGRGYVALSQFCERYQLKVIADVHTHPGTWVGQSLTDQQHPMMSRAGHIALIVPEFAQRNRFTDHGVGVYLLRTAEDWQADGATLRLILT